MRAKKSLLRFFLFLVCFRLKPIAKTKIDKIFQPFFKILSLKFQIFICKNCAYSITLYIFNIYIKQVGYNVYSKKNSCVRIRKAFQNLILNKKFMNHFISMCLDLLIIRIDSAFYEKLLIFKAGSILKCCNALGFNLSALNHYVALIMCI